MSAARKRQKAYGKTAKKGAAWSVVRQSGHELIAIPSSMVMARLLTPSEFGVAAAASFFVLLASRLTQFGFSAALVRVKELRPEHASSVFAVSLGFGMLSYLALFVSAPYVGAFFNSADAGRLLPVAALTFLISPVGTVSGALLSRRMQFKYLAIADWTDMGVGAIVTIALAYNGWSYWSIAVGHVVAVAIRVVLQLFLARWRPSLRFSRAALNEILSFGLGIQAKRVLEYASFHLDNLIVGRFLGMAALGLYDKAFTTMNRLVTRLTLGQAPFRIFSIIHEDAERFRRAYAQLVLAVTLIGYPAFAAAIAIAAPLFEVMYGPQWTGAVLPFQLLCVGGMLKLLNAYGAQANEAAGGIWGQVRRQAVGAVLVVIGASLGSVYGGVSGAALGVAVAMMFLTISMQALVRRATGLSWGAMLSPQIPGVTVAIVLAGVLVGTDATLHAMTPQPPAWLRLVVQVSIGAIAYAGLVLFSPFQSVRALIRDTAEDLVPAPARPAVHWLTRATRVGNAT